MLGLEFFKKSDACKAYKKAGLVTGNEEEFRKISYQGLASGEAEICKTVLLLS